MDTDDDLEDMPRPLPKPVIVEEEDEIQFAERVLLYELWPEAGLTVCHVIALVVVLYLALKALTYISLWVYQRRVMQQSRKLLIERNQREYNFKKDLVDLDVEKIIKLDVAGLR